ncbi:hypothetical protein OG21DRAFT_1426035, partial [Imleria badia]
QGTYETQETSTSIRYSNVSPIAHLPNSQFSLHKVTPYIAAKSGRGSRKVNVLLIVLEVHGPDTILVKKGSVCKLTAWSDTADGRDGFFRAKRGHIVYFESTLHGDWETGSIVILTASLYNRPFTDLSTQRQ